MSKGDSRREGTKQGDEKYNLIDLKQKALFLYTELAGYALACFDALVKRGIEVHVVHFPVNSEAPFDLHRKEGVFFYERKRMNRHDIFDLAERISPTIIICSGWIDKDYVNVCRKFRHSAITVLAMDNKWSGSLKQHIASVAGKFTISRYFHNAWVPGSWQAKYAMRLGFRKECIRTGFYSCDHPYFDHLYSLMRADKEKNFPHRFIFSGRYYDFKGVQELWEAFTEQKKEYPNDWELWCMGTGTVIPLQHPSIKHFGFIQPSDLGKYMKDAGVFVMPSRFEPWGVALHEFTAAGFPVICSDQVGAAEAFLQEGKNGLSFPAGDKWSLKNAMRKMMTLSDKELGAMGVVSSELAKKITPSAWAQTVFKMMQP